MESRVGGRWWTPRHFSVHSGPFKQLAEWLLLELHFVCKGENFGEEKWTQIWARGKDICLSYEYLIEHLPCTDISSMK